MHAQGGYDDGAAHLTAFATTDDVFVILWRQNTAGTILGHRIISLRDVGSESLIFQAGAPAVDSCRAILALQIMRSENESCSNLCIRAAHVAACQMTMLAASFCADGPECLQISEDQAAIPWSPDLSQVRRVDLPDGPRIPNASMHSLPPNKALTDACKQQHACSVV